MNLVHFLLLLFWSTNGLAMVAVPSSQNNVTSPTDPMDVIEDSFPGSITVENNAQLDHTTDNFNIAVSDNLVDERAFPPTNGFMELATWGITCNYSEPLIPPMVWRPTLSWCRVMMRCNVNGDIVAAMYSGPSAVEQQSWNWCMRSCHCYEMDRPAAHYKANFGCPNPAGGYVRGGIGSSSKRDDNSSSDPGVTEFLGGLVMDLNHAAHNNDNTTTNWPEVILAEDQDPAVKTGYDPSNPAWVNPIYMLTSCTLYPAMDSHGLILALAKMMDWCGCEHRLNSEGNPYGGVSIYDPATNVRVWACRCVLANKDRLAPLHPLISLSISLHSSHVFTSSVTKFRELTNPQIQRCGQYNL